jgi:hypothetical protein
MECDGEAAERLYQRLNVVLLFRRGYGAPVLLDRAFQKAALVVLDRP